MSQKIIINKFGGGVLHTRFIPFIEKRLKDQIQGGYLPVVVVSALPGVTDKLLNFLISLKEKKTKKIGGTIKDFVKDLSLQHTNTIKEIGLNGDYALDAQVKIAGMMHELEKLLVIYASGEVSVLMEDHVIAYGEKLSATLFSYYLESINIHAKRTFAEEIPITTDDHYKNANIIYPVSEKNIQKYFLKSNTKNTKEVFVIPGFTGKTIKGKTTTLGRGGTDTTACLLGASLRAEKIILWKDVGGVMSADPRIVKEAQTIPFISYQEAEEAGKIIHSKAIQYVKLHNTPIEIVSLENPTQKTTIGKLNKTKKGAKIVSYKKNLSLFVVTDETKKENDMLATVSSAFAKHKVDVLLISNTRYSLQIVVDNTGGVAEGVYKEIQAKFLKVENSPVSMVFLIGNFDVYDVNEFNSMLIKLKADMEISAFLYKNCTRLEAVINGGDIENVIRSLHKKFISQSGSKK